MFFGGMPGEPLLEKSNLERVRMLGSRLFGESRQSAQGECPSCWSDIWKFPEPALAVCPLCGQKAELVVGDKGVQWIFGPESTRHKKEELKHHSEELQGKVKEYISRRNELEAIQNPYKGEGTWLKP